MAAFSKVGANASFMDYCVTYLFVIVFYFFAVRFYIGLCYRGLVSWSSAKIKKVDNHAPGSKANRPFDMLNRKLADLYERSKTGHPSF